jgi:phage-related protein
MGFLKKLGKALQFVGGIVGLVNPMVTSIVTSTPSTADDTIWGAFQRIFGVVMRVEIAVAQLFDTTLTGAQKLAMAVPEVIQIIVPVLQKLGLKIADQVKFKAGVEQIISGVVAVLNSCHEDGAKVEKV